MFEMPEMQIVDRQCNQSIQGANANPSTTVVNNSFVRKNSTDAEHLLMDEKFWYSLVIEGNETSTNESEVAVPSFHSLFDWKYRGQAKYPPLSRSYFAKQAKKQILERCKISKSCQEVGEAVKGTTLGQMLVTPSEETRPENRNYRIDVCALNNQLSWHDASEQVSSVESLSLDSEMVAISETTNVEALSGTPEKLQLDRGVCILSLEEESSSHVLDASVGQETSTKSHEEAFIFFSWPVLEEEFPMCLGGEAYSPSPSSVLEPPFSEEISSYSDSFQGAGAILQGLRVQLELLKSESEETNAEGHGMAVSSDEESGDGYVDFSKESRVLIGLFTAEESRNLSYVVDLLDETGFHGGNTCFGIEWWYCTLQVSLSTLQCLRFYRRNIAIKHLGTFLLFDCINLGLKEILQPCMDVLTWGKDLRKKLNLSREVIEEELWMFLVGWKKEVGKELPEKALGTEIRWFELREDIDFIVCQIERFFIDELATEFACVESF